MRLDEFGTLCLVRSLMQRLLPFSYQKIQSGLIKSALNYQPSNNVKFKNYHEEN